MPSDTLARVFGAYDTFVTASIALGALITPLVISALSLDASLVVAGLVLPALCLLGWPWLRRMDQANAARLAVLAPRVAQLERIPILAEELDVPAGHAVVREGEDADAFYVVVSGELLISARGEGNIERSLPALSGGDYFGEIGLLEHIPRTATVTTASPCQLLRIPGEDFLNALTQGSPSPTLLEGARIRLARTHPSHRPRTPPTDD
jgi:hypothetical protein